jgi:hypothetical protein
VPFFGSGSELQNAAIHDTASLQLYRHEAEVRGAEKLVRRRMVSPVKRIAHSKKALTDDVYYVSAAAVADKIIDRMRHGLDPLLIRSSMLLPVPAAATLNARLQRKPD